MKSYSSRIPDRVSGFLARTFSFVQPPLKAGFALSAPPTLEQVLDAEILVQVGPVNAMTASTQLVSLAFLWRCVCETRIPGKRNGQASTVREMNDEAILVDADAYDLWILLKFQSSHAMHSSMFHNSSDCSCECTKETTWAI
ncbi:MAG: hypothetical protein ACRDLA_00545 [Thermoleophilaceae bacterium]